MSTRATAVTSLFRAPHQSSSCSPLCLAISLLPALGTRLLCITATSAGQCLSWVKTRTPPQRAHVRYRRRVRTLAKRQGQGHQGSTGQGNQIGGNGRFPLPGAPGKAVGPLF
jgi:hypothetical protein